MFFCVAILLSSSLAAEVVISVPGLGSLKGVESEGVRSFKGVPFAQPPVEDLRFAPPQPAKPWGGSVLDATDFKHNCMQNPSPLFMGWPQPLSTLSEDCLYLNVYAPAKARSTGKGAPVMFWIYGGGYKGGGGNETRLNGTYDVRLMSTPSDAAIRVAAESAGAGGAGAAADASEGLVVVTINYRLNVFGFIAADELRYITYVKFTRPSEYISLYFIGSGTSRTAVPVTMESKTSAWQ